MRKDNPLRNYRLDDAMISRANKAELLTLPEIFPDSSETPFIV
jgi:hypothetical protein